MMTPAVIYERIIAEIARLFHDKERITLAIDGRCASGKTTLAGKLQALLPDCRVFHTDDFFLRPEQRTSQRLSEAGGNMDRERLRDEILQSLAGGGEIVYRPFDCMAASLLTPVKAPDARVSIVEGTYSCHAELRKFYDLTIFLSTSPSQQLLRLSQRDGANIETFMSRWIPMEEKYFRECAPAASCDLFFET